MILNINLNYVQYCNEYKGGVWTYNLQQGCWSKSVKAIENKPKTTTLRQTGACVWILDCMPAN